VAAIFNFSTPNIPDSDGFFYIRLADHFRQNGLGATDFPWLKFSVIKNLSIGIWYGFGIFLIPFSLFSNLVFGIKLAGVFLMAIALFGIFWVAKRQNFSYPAFWSLLALFSAPNVLFRFLMTRPQLASLGISTFLFYGLTNNLWLIVGLASLAIVWIHFNFFWLPIVIWLAVAVAQIIFEKRFYWKNILAVASGVLLGWVLRPDFLRAARLVYVQTVQQTLSKQTGLPLLFGAENYPLSANVLFGNFFVFLLLWLGGTILFFWNFKNLNAGKKVFSFSALLLSAGFFILTMVVARRVYDFWAVFGVLAIGAAVSDYLQNLRADRNLSSWLKIIFAGSFAFLVLFSTYKNSISLAERAYSPNILREPAVWLGKNSQPSEVVFNLHWSDFSPLWFWNQKNYYIGGLDPIFQYAYSPELYWKFHYLSADDIAEKTCGAPACTAEMLEDAYIVLKRDFDAKYVLLKKNQNPLVYAYLSKDLRFVKVFENEDGETVFVLK